MSFLGKLDELSTSKRARMGWTYAAIAVFILLIVVPTIYVLFAVFGYWGDVSSIISDSEKMNLIWTAVWNSFSVAIIVTVIDIIIGLPMAWIIVRKKFRGLRILDTLIDMPLAFPTAVLGISVVTFWGNPQGISVPGLGLELSPYVMLILLHTIFTYPYMVRSLAGILEQIDENYETAAMTLGASRFTAVRTITLPLFRAGLVTGFILCFARSLSETGGTQIALSMMGVENWFFTGPTLIVDNSRPMQIVISVLMILFALLLLFLAKYLMTRINLPWSKVFPKWERKVSRGKSAKVSNALTIFLLFLLVLIPAFWLFTSMDFGGEPIEWGQILCATGISFLIAGVAVAFDIVFGMPVALYISRNRNSKIAKILDELINIPLIVPTAALGVSLGMFWSGTGLNGAGLLLVIFGHIAFTYPLMVRNITGALEEVDVSYEEISMTLGAKPFQAFRKILLPIIRSSVVAGGILSFTRSLGETGATVSIDNTVISIPVLIVNWIDQGNYHQAIFASVFLVVICFILLLIVRRLTRGDRNA